MAISAHGAVVKLNGTAISEVKDVTPPPLSREPIERTRWDDEDDEHIVSIRKAGELEFRVNLIESDPTHQGLLDAWTNGSLGTWELTFADGAVWTFDGFVVDILPTTPIDGGLEMSVSVQVSAGVIFGAVVGEFLLQETGDYILLENGGRISL